jgi:hypothetical protein
MTFSARASATPPSFTGQYDLVNPKLGRTFLLDVKQTGSRATVSFVAKMADGSGGSEGAGKGRLDDGVLSFDFTDKLKNEGSGTLTFTKAGYTLSLTVLKVVDVSTFHFYGNLLLKRTTDMPRQSLSTEKM